MSAADKSVAMTINVRLGVSISVNATRDACGDVQIESVRGFIGLPTPSDIFDAMDSYDLGELDAEFAAAEGGAQ